MAARVYGEEEWGRDCSWGQSILWDDKSVLKSITVIVTQLCKYMKTTEPYTSMGELYGMDITSQ